MHHPFCCVSSTIPDPMTPPPPPPPPPPGSSSSSSNVTTAGDHSGNYHSSAKQIRINNSTGNNNGNSIPHPPPTAPPLSRSSQPPSRREIAQLTAAAGTASGAAKINDIVGNGISGILYKWVNYGKGWRPRWFVLQDGVLSYYKIHGPDKIFLNQETEKGVKVIGEESLKRISRPNHQRNAFSSSSSQKIRKPVGEVHLKV